MVNWCWEGECVRYGRLRNNIRNQIISAGRFKCSDIDSLESGGGFSLLETTPEELGLQRDDGKGDECSAFNDFKFPPIFPPPPPEDDPDLPIPSVLILDVKNNVTNRDVFPQEVTFQLIPNPDIDRVSIVKTIWDFGDGTPQVVTEGLFGGAPGFSQKHLYQFPINFNGTITLQVLDVNRNVLQSETSTFNGVILEEEPITPLNLILDVFADSEEAPANVRLEVTANTAFDNLSINYGDGSALTTNKNHTYLINGTYEITVAATTKSQGTPGSTSRIIRLARPPPPPGADQIIFDVRRTETSSFPFVPTTVNYKITINPDFLNRRFKLRITWIRNNVVEFQGNLKDGDEVTGESQSFNFELPGNKTIQGIVELFENEITSGTGNTVFVKQEEFTDQLELFVEEGPLECVPGFHEENGVCVPDEEDPPIICNPGFHLENGTCVPDTIVCNPGFHEENGVCVPDPIECIPGFHLEGGVCVADPIECIEGFHEENGVCVPDTPPIECNEGFHEENGVCVPNPPPEDDCEEGFHEENGVCVIDTIDCEEGFHEENGACVPNEPGPPPGETKIGRNVIIASLAVAAGVAAIAVSKR